VSKKNPYIESYIHQSTGFTDEAKNEHTLSMSNYQYIPRKRAEGALSQESLSPSVQA